MKGPSIRSGRSQTRAVPRPPTAFRLDLRLGACRFREAAMPGPRKTACSLRVLSGKASQPGWKCSTDRPRPTGPGTGACPPGRPSGPGPRPRRAPQYPLSTLWATCPDVPPGYTRPAVGLPYHGVCRWVRQPAEWTRRSVRWATDSALAHHTSHERLHSALPGHCRARQMEGPSRHPLAALLGVVSSIGGAVEARLVGIAAVGERERLRVD